MLGRQPAAIYGRVLIDWQTTEGEIGVLKEVAAEREWEVGEIYIDDAIRSGKRKDKRPAFDKMLEDAKNRQLGSVMAWSIGLLAPSVQGIIGVITRMQALDLIQYYHKEAIDTSTPTGKAMAQICVLLSSVERASPVLKRARSEGGHLPHIKIGPQTEWAICQALASGRKGILKIATDFRVSSSTVQRIKAEMNKLT